MRSKIIKKEMERRDKKGKWSKTLERKVDRESGKRTWRLNM